MKNNVLNILGLLILPIGLVVLIVGLVLWMIKGVKNV